jgi:hypothetical protein
MNSDSGSALTQAAHCSSVIDDTRSRLYRSTSAGTGFVANAARHFVSA